MQLRNLIILVFSQLISATGSIVFITLGGIIGATLASDKAWATLPITMIVLASAVTAIPATMLMRKIGRAQGFASASLSAVLAVLIAALALWIVSFPLFLVAGLLFGINLAFTQQYRYAAAESVDSKYIPRAISFVLVGSIGGALIGPEIAIRGQHWIADVPYSGVMLALACLYALQSVLFLFLQKTRAETATQHADPGRTLMEIVKQPVFIVAVLGGTAGYGLMTLIMTATPLSMHINDGYSVEQVGNVIRAHVLGMYVPSLVSGFLIERLGVVRMMFVGAIALIGTTIVGLQGQTVVHYWWALVLLGIGWNFLYVGGTTMLTYSYTVTERFRAQGCNEFLVFGTSATASLLAGTVMHFYGWNRLMWIPLPALIVVCVALVLVRKDKLLDRSSSSSDVKDMA
ncbi:MAG: MFS transporter [Proteobacteria bacterium]|nr:MFS transporter [Pseudomonadota bacterium]